MGVDIVAHALALVAAGGISPVQVDLLLVGQQVPPVFEGLSTPWADLILNLHVHNLHVPQCITLEGLSPTV